MRLRKIRYIVKHYAGVCLGVKICLDDFVGRRVVFKTLDFYNRVGLFELIKRHVAAKIYLTADDLKRRIRSARVCDTKIIGQDFKFALLSAPVAKLPARDSAATISDQGFDFG